MKLYLTGSKLKEGIIFLIISYGGSAKALVYEAIEASDEGDFEKAQSLLEEANASFKVAA
ncbi:PTS lactose/cellobiose transporter subunit IIA [Aerococcus sp. NPDC058936]|uniref:PTS lactose/cellobiose transporter subunit IIA n=1 Tax=Aerococcus sp. NPDC058936 TaxID=3346674 RepID=UPI00366C36CD